MKSYKPAKKVEKMVAKAWVVKLPPDKRRHIRSTLQFNTDFVPPQRPTQAAGLSCTPKQLFLSVK
jgi:hypothetical protein